MIQDDENPETTLSPWSRWSRRKHEQQRVDTKEPEPTEDLATQQQLDSTEDRPLWQQDGVDAEKKKIALASLFRQPEFNDVDHMNEYDEDFTKFSSLGGIVTQEMKRMVKVIEQRTRPEQQDEAIISQQENDEDNKDDLSA